MDVKSIKTALIGLKQNRELAMQGEKPNLFQLEVEILYWHLRNLNNKAIARKLGDRKYYSTIHSVKYGIYQHFSRPPANIQLGDANQRMAVAKVLSEALGHPPEFEPWPPESLKKEVGPKMVITKPATREEPNPEPEIRPLPMVIVDPDLPPPEPTVTDDGPPIGLLVVVGLAILLGVTIGLVTWVNNKISSIPPPGPGIVATGIAGGQELIFPDETDTPVVIHEVETVIVEKIITETPLPGPSSTPLPTNTPEPTATLTVVEPFEYYFADGPIEEIVELDDNLVWGGGTLSSNGSAWFTIGDPNWVNYRVEIIEPHISDRGISSMDIGIRGQSVSNLVVFRYLKSEGIGPHGYWMIIEGGNEEKVNNTTVDGLNDISTIALEVRDDSFTAFTPIGEPSHFFHSGNEKGKIFIRIGHNTRMDGIRISPLED